MKILRAAVQLTPVAVALLTGCGSARDARIREHPEAYATLDAFHKKLVQEGYFDIGFSRDQVYIALGKPDRVEKKDTPEGPVEIWVYKNYLYGNPANPVFSQRDPTSTRRNVRASRTAASSASVPNTEMSAPAPTIAEMSGPALATLRLELREGQVVGAHLEF